MTESTYSKTTRTYIYIYVCTERKYYIVACISEMNTKTFTWNVKRQKNDEFAIWRTTQARNGRFLGLTTFRLLFRVNVTSVVRGRTHQREKMSGRVIKKKLTQTNTSDDRAAAARFRMNLDDRCDARGYSGRRSHDRGCGSRLPRPRYTGLARAAATITSFTVTRGESSRSDRAIEAWFLKMFSWRFTFFWNTGTSLPTRWDNGGGGGYFRRDRPCEN